MKRNILLEPRPNDCPVIILLEWCCSEPFRDSWGYLRWTFEKEESKLHKLNLLMSSITPKDVVFTFNFGSRHFLQCHIHES